MFTFISFFVLLLLIIIVQCANISVNFATFPVNTDIGICTCDLTANACDALCCCDPDCSAGDKTVFNCSSRDNQFTNTTPSISTVQPTCFKNISIFESNSPYIIQKMGELVCVDYARYYGSQYYQQPTVQTLDPGVFVQILDAENSVTAPPALPTNVTNYEVGAPILTYNTARSVTNYYSLPISLFNNQFCSGSESITYMNDFTSTCSQPVNSNTCGGSLNPLTYIDPLCLIQSPANLNTRICDNTTAINSTFSNTCVGALQTLTITIFYLNPTGIESVSVTYTTANASTSVPFQQTFTVNFVQSGSSPSSSYETRNPGYLQGANIIAAIANDSVIQTIVTSQFAILQPLPTGFCDVTASSIPISFGENVQSTCQYSVNSTTACPSLDTLLIPINSINLYIAAYSNPNQSNITTDWLPVISCTYEMGSTNSRGCQNGLIINGSSNSLCYVRLDIQIAYTNIGSVNNPQPVLSAVIFHYQGVSVSATAPLPSTLLITKTVTFQDISPAPIIEYGEIPTPNTQLPADFFYPFSVSQATKSMTLSSYSYFIISIIFILM